jgi:hypothetical protein
MHGGLDAPLFEDVGLFVRAANDLIDGRGWDHHAAVVVNPPSAERMDAGAR